jgi:hypothetical protein
MEAFKKMKIIKILLILGFLIACVSTSTANGSTQQLYNGSYITSYYSNTTNPSYWYQNKNNSLDQVGLNPNLVNINDMINKELISKIVELPPANINDCWKTVYVVKKDFDLYNY